MNIGVEAIDLGKRYRRTWALRHCLLQIPTGRVAAIVGPNGAGKTTLLHLATGLLMPTEGSIRILGWAPREDPELVLARLGFVGQEAPLYRGYSVRDTLRLGRALNRRWDGAYAVARLRRLGIPLDRRVGQLSGGQVLEREGRAAPARRQGGDLAAHPQGRLPAGVAPADDLQPREVAVLQAAGSDQEPDQVMRRPPPVCAPERALRGWTDM